MLNYQNLAKVARESEPHILIEHLLLVGVANEAHTAVNRSRLQVSRREVKADGLVAESEPLVLSRDMSAEHSTFLWDVEMGLLGISEQAQDAPPLQFP